MIHLFLTFQVLLQDPEEATCGVNKNVTTEILHFRSLSKWGYTVKCSFKLRY